MKLDYEIIDFRRDNDHAWQLLRADHAPLIIGFLYRVFTDPNVRVRSEEVLINQLDSDLFSLNAGEKVRYPKSAGEYLTDWSNPEKGWLRKFYPPDSDEPHYEQTSASEKAISWVLSLQTSPFVGTESRLLTAVGLLRQIHGGTETDMQKRLEVLYKKRDEIEKEIEKTGRGEIPILTDTEVKERFLQFSQLTKELLRDFREVENNFRKLGQQMREEIALWIGGKGELLEHIFGDRDVIDNSDQGRSFNSFWSILMASGQLDEIANLIEYAFSLPPVAEISPDSRLRSAHLDWIDAGGYTQKMVRTLSKQIGRFLDDKVWLENRRIMDILHSIEADALVLRDEPPQDSNFMLIDGTEPTVSLPFEQPMYTSAQEIGVVSVDLTDGEATTDAALLLAQNFVNKSELISIINSELRIQSQVALRAIIDTHPLEHGLAELVTYINIANEREESVINRDVFEYISWDSDEDKRVRAKLPQIIFIRE